MLISITTMIPTRSGFVWHPCETDDRTIDDLMDDLAQDGAIQVTKLDAYRNSAGEFIVRHRSPMIFGVNMVGTITPLHVRVRDETPADRERADRERTAA